jgi:hypothetical protein
MMEREIAIVVARRPLPLGEVECQQLIALGADLGRAWSHPAATAATRKRILRAALNEIIVRKEGAVIDMILHWQGGDHTALQFKLRLNAAARAHPRVSADTISLVRELARLMPDAKIAHLLNRSGKPTGSATVGPSSACAASEATMRSRATETASGPSATRSRSRLRPRSSESPR